MGPGACKAQKGSISRSKCGAVFTFLVVIAVYFSQHRMLQFQQREHVTLQHPATSPPPRLQRGFCSFRPRSSQDALEERRLLDAFAWPQMPHLPPPFRLSQASDPANSTFTLLSQSRGQQWHKGDELRVMIQMRDSRGRPKTFGGDVLIARLHNLTLGAGVAGQVVDHLNGSYSAVFPLLWEGMAQVEVTLVHSVEAVAVLHRLTIQQPDRIPFQSLFRSGSVSETTACSVCLEPTKRQVCNFTDLQTGEPWFCYKPKRVSCDARTTHNKGNLKTKLNAKDKMLFQSGVNMKASIRPSGSACVNVLPQKKGQPMVRKGGPSGYYYQGAWQALGDTAVRQFNQASDISRCLKNKRVHLYGDSTIRQWFEYLTDALPDLREFNLHSGKQTGPFMALDYTNNILVTFRCHGPPVRFTKVPVRELRYIANELDHLIGGANTVVVLGIWSHFSTFPMEVYIWRLQTIRRAVERLLRRAPDTAVIIRTANLKALPNLYEVLSNSDWYSLQLDRVLRAMFKGLGVHMVDAWDMTLAHHLPHNLHPQLPIIKNMIDVVLSYVCPMKGS